MERTKSELLDKLNEWAYKAEDMYDEPKSQLKAIYERDEFVQVYLTAELKKYSMEHGWTEVK